MEWKYNLFSEDVSSSEKIFYKIQEENHRKEYLKK